MPDRVDTAVERMQAPGLNTPVDLDRPTARLPVAGFGLRLVLPARQPRDHAVEKPWATLPRISRLSRPDRGIAPALPSTRGSAHGHLRHRAPWLGLRRGAPPESDVAAELLDFAGQEYAVADGARRPSSTSRTLRRGYSLRLRYEARLDGPCMRCLESAGQTVRVDAREVDQAMSPTRRTSRRSSSTSRPKPGTRWRWRCRPRSSAGTSAGSARSAENPHGPARASRNEREPDPRWAALRELKGIERLSNGRPQAKTVSLADEQAPPQHKAAAPALQECPRCHAPSAASGLP